VYKPSCLNYIKPLIEKYPEGDACPAPAANERRGMPPLLEDPPREVECQIPSEIPGYDDLTAPTFEDIEVVIDGSQQCSTQSDVDHDDDGDW